MVLHRPVEPAGLTGKSALVARLAASTVFVQVVRMVLPSVRFRRFDKKYVAQAHNSTSAIHEMRDACNPNVSVPPRTPEGTMSFELLIAACSSIVRNKLPLVRT